MYNSLKKTYLFLKCNYKHCFPIVFAVIAHYLGFDIPFLFFLGTWSAGGNLATARRYLAGAGTQSAGLSFGGVTTIYLTITEEYNGTSWSSGGNLGTTRRFLAGCGTQSAGL
ncbi:hypothetical protein KKA83_03125, partial [Patescibacteria group bacterium]|nr:hypothetical protein [Patescibacteria group bacterium]